MNITTLIEIFINKIPLWIIQYLFCGSNKTQKNQIGHKNGGKIRINKYLHVGNRQIEFIQRIIVINLIFYIINYFCLVHISGLQLQFKVYLIAILMITEWGGSFFIYDDLFKKYLIGFDIYDEKRMEQLTRPIWFFHFILCLLGLGGIYAFATIDITLAGFTFLSLLFLIIIIFVYYRNYKSKKIERYDIKSFKGGLDHQCGDYVKFDMDIRIYLKNHYYKQINLLESDLYICDNDDVYIISKDKEVERLEKEKISYIAIKNDAIYWRNEELGWGIYSE